VADTMRVIIPKEPFLDGAAIVRAVENSLSEAAASAKTDFGATTRTWDSQPDFTIDSRPGVREVYTTNDVYGYLNRGTAVRRAVMVGGFRPKTRHRYIGSNKGKGGVVFISKKLSLPGIEAREFDIAVKEKMDDEVPVKMQRAIAAEVTRQNRG